MRSRLAASVLAAALLLGLPPISRGVRADPPAAEGSLAHVAFGGPGVTACRDAECLDGQYRVLGVVTLRNRTGGELTGLASVRVDVLGADGSVVSTSREVAELVVVQSATPESDATFAPGRAFDGRLPPGTTRLRVQAWMTRRPVEAARVRFVFGAQPSAISVSGTLPPYEWPT